MRLSVGDIGVALRHPLLHRDRAAHRIDDAGELDQQAVAGGLDDAAVMLGDLRIDELAAQRPEAFEGALLVGAHQPRIARHIGREDRRETAGLAHSSRPPPGAGPTGKFAVLVVAVGRDLIGIT